MSEQQPGMSPETAAHISKIDYARHEENARQASTAEFDSDQASQKQQALIYAAHAVAKQMVTRPGYRDVREVLAQSADKDERELGVILKDAGAESGEAYDKQQRAEHTLETNLAQSRQTVHENLGAFEQAAIEDAARAGVETSFGQSQSAQQQEIVQSKQ